MAQDDHQPCQNWRGFSLVHMAVYPRFFFSAHDGPRKYRMNYCFGEHLRTDLPESPQGTTDGHG